MAKLVIEIGTVGATHPVYCWVNGEHLRGRHTQQNILRTGLRPNRGLEQIDGWPGMYVALDDVERTCKIYYPLERDSREFMEFREQCKAAGNEAFATPEEFRYDKLDDEQFAEWAFWTRRVVEDGIAKVREGAVFPHTPIRVQRIRRMHEFYSNPENLFREEMAHEAPGSLAMAGAGAGAGATSKSGGKGKGEA